MPCRFVRHTSALTFAEVPYLLYRAMRQIAVHACKYAVASVETPCDDVIRYSNDSLKRKCEVQGEVPKPGRDGSVFALICVFRLVLRTSVSENRWNSLFTHAAEEHVAVG